MKTILRPRWLTAGLLGSTLLVGCQSVQPAPRTAAVQARPSQVAQVRPADPTPVKSMPGDVVSQQKVSAVPVSESPPPPVQDTALHIPPQVVQETAMQIPPPPPGVTPVDMMPGKSPFPRGEPQPRRREATDITARGSFGHAGDYKWISGQAISYRGEWRLRYASVDEMDDFGGSLVLLGSSLQSDLRDGEQFKLTGFMVEHDARAGGPAFHVESVEPVSSKEQ
jgi:hypothetical protein